MFDSNFILATILNYTQGEKKQIMLIQPFRSFAKDLGKEKKNKNLNFQESWVYMYIMHPHTSFEFLVKVPHWTETSLKSYISFWNEIDGIKFEGEYVLQ